MASGIVADAEQHATDLRTDAESIHAKAKADAAESDRLCTERAAAMEAEHSTTMNAARTQASQLVAKAHADADELARQSKQTRTEERRRHDSTLAEERRQALAEAKQIRDTARDLAIERLAGSRNLSAKADDARTQVLEEFEEIRTKLVEIQREFGTFPDTLRPAEDIDYTSLSDADDSELLNRILSERARFSTGD